MNLSATSLPSSKIGHQKKKIEKGKFQDITLPDLEILKRETFHA